MCLHQTVRFRSLSVKNKKNIFTKTVSSKACKRNRCCTSHIDSQKNIKRERGHQKQNYKGEKCFSCRMLIFFLFLTAHCKTPQRKKKLDASSKKKLWVSASGDFLCETMLHLFTSLPSTWISKSTWCMRTGSSGHRESSVVLILQ